MKPVFPVLTMCCLVMFSAAVAYAEGTTPVVREEQSLLVDGVEERWSLEWVSPQVEACGPDEENWSTCPCTGFAFGERGNLDLVRRVPGKKDERFSLTQLFKYASDLPLAGDTIEAILQRWDVQPEDYDNSDVPGFGVRVRARPVSRVMHFADYDHDGRATEFALQIGTLPCGKRMSVVVGISRSKPRLHVFSSVKHPKQPLILQSWQWDKLSRAKGPIKAVDWRCGDHGSDVETELELRADDGNIHETRTEYECTKEGQRGRLKNKEDF